MSQSMQYCTTLHKNVTHQVNNSTKGQTYSNDICFCHTTNMKHSSLTAEMHQCFLLAII